MQGCVDGNYYTCVIIRPKFTFLKVLGPLRSNQNMLGKKKEFIHLIKQVVFTAFIISIVFITSCPIKTAIWSLITDDDLISLTKDTHTAVTISINPELGICSPAFFLEKHDSESYSNSLEPFFSALVVFGFWSLPIKVLLLRHFRAIINCIHLQFRSSLFIRLCSFLL